MTNLNDFAEWQAEQPKTRSVDIKINPTRHGEEEPLKVWAYDYDLREGQQVTTAAEIDLEGKKREADLRQLAELKAKYETKEVA
jgi:hypothetical protein